MIHVLVIGREAGEWEDILSAREHDGLAARSAQRPGEALRAFDELSPDMVVIAEPAGSERLEPLVAAIRGRPLGQMVPIAVAADDRPGLDDSNVDVISDRGGLGERLESHFELDFSLSGDTEPELASPENVQTAELDTIEAEESTDSSERNERIEGDGYVVEPLEESDEEASHSARAPTSPDETVQRDSAASRSDVDEAAIDRKLRTVRHDDYFAILELERSADVRDVLEAHRRLRDQFRTSNLEPSLARSYSDALEEIADALDDARAVLGDETLREQYLDATTRT